LAAVLGQRASANAQAWSYQVTVEVWRAIESGRPEAMSNASPLSAACISCDRNRSACAFFASVSDFPRPATVHRTVHDDPVAVFRGRISQNRTRWDFTPAGHRGSRAS
jgi:hypothetical protein